MRQIKEHDMVLFDNNTKFGTVVFIYEDNNNFEIEYVKKDCSVISFDDQGKISDIEGEKFIQTVSIDRISTLFI